MGGNLCNGKSQCGLVDGPTAHECVLISSETVLCTPVELDDLSGRPPFFFVSRLALGANGYGLLFLVKSTKI